jgi:hypothetical protein
MGGGKDRRRILIAGAALLGLLAAVGLASRAHTPTGGGSTRSFSTDILLEYALVLTVAWAVVVIPVAIYLRVAQNEQEDKADLPPRRNWVPGAFFALTIFAIVAFVRLGTGLFKSHHAHPKSKGVGGILTPSGNGRAVQAIRFEWTPVIVVGLLTVAVLTAIVFAFMRHRQTARPRRIQHALVLALEKTLDDLRAEPDPRKAVIAAYAQMEHALARAGLPREPAEAPREYLERVLPEIGAGADSVERLTALFERAKFSPHAIDEAMKEEAIAALESLRDELRGTS